MAGKPLEFHPEAEQEYLEALAWYRGGTGNEARLRRSASKEHLIAR